MWRWMRSPGSSVRVGSVGWPVVSLQRHGEVRGLEVLGCRDVGRQGEMLRVVLALGLRSSRGCGGRGRVGNARETVEILELFRSDGGRLRRAQVVRTGPHDSRWRLGVTGRRRRGRQGRRYAGALVSRRRTRRIVRARTSAVAPVRQRPRAVVQVGSVRGWLARSVVV